MGAIAPWLLAIAWPLVKKVLVSLGIGTLTYGGLSLIYGQVESQVLSAWGSLGGATLAIASLGGIPQMLGIILGALSARLAYIAYGRIGKLAG